MAAETCPYCDRIRKEQDAALYEDEVCIAFLEKRSAVQGQVVAMPKEHYAIMELVPDYIINHLVQVVNKLSVSVFDSLGVQGTNLLVHNGVAAGQEYAHFTVQIMPRKENDSINFTWTPKHLSEEEMATVELSLKDEAAHIGGFELEKKETAVIREQGDQEETAQKPSEENDTDSRDNYELRQLNRIP